MVGVVLLIIIYRITHSYIAIATYLSQLARVKIMLNKNTLGVKKVRGQSEAAL